MAKRSSGSPRGLARLSVTDLQAEINRRQRGVAKLLRKRERLLARLNDINKQIQSHGVSVGSGSGAGGGAASGRRRARNQMSLVEALSKVLNGKTMSVTDVSEAVQRAGYQTTSPSFRTIVNQALISSGKFKRVDRGQYTLK